MINNNINFIYTLIDYLQKLTEDADLENYTISINNEIFSNMTNQDDNVKPIGSVTTITIRQGTQENIKLDSFKRSTEKWQ